MTGPRSTLAPRLALGLVVGLALGAAIGAAGAAQAQSEAQDGWVTTSSAALTSSAADPDPLGFHEAPPELEDEAPGAEDSRSQRAVFIEAIELIGNGKTADDVIEARLLVGVGELVDDDRIEESRLRLLSTGYFKSVELSLKRGTRRGRVVLVIEVEERNTLTIDGLYLGFSDVAPIYGGLGLVESNFLGRGMSLGVGGVLGKDRRALDVRVFVPDLSSTRLQLSAAAVIVQGAEVLDTNEPAGLALTYSRLGGSLGLGFRLPSAQRVGLDYRLESIEAPRLPNIDPALLRAAPSIQFDRSVLSTVSLVYERDTRDDGFVPTQGGRVALSVELGSKILASSYEFSKYTGEFELAFQPYAPHALRVHALAGLVQGRTPFFNQFFQRDFMAFAAGSDALPRVLGVNFSSENDYDDLVITGGADYSIPLLTGGDLVYRAYVYFGVDVAATASLDEIQEDPDGRGPRGRFPISFDAGLRFDTWIGHFSLSAAYLVDLVL